MRETAAWRGNAVGEERQWINGRIMTRVAMWSVLSAIALVGCFHEDEIDPNDVTGPYSGPITRYVVDGFTLPMTSTMARELGDDLDGDKSRDNQLGMVLGTLAAGKNLTTHAPEMIASGVLASSVEIQADSLANDATVRVWYYGAEGDVAGAVGGTLIDGAFVSNRTRTTRVPGTARLRLPVFVDVDPIEVELHAMELDLTPDGRGGFDAIVRGGIRIAEARQAAYDGILDMLAAFPQDHRTFFRVLERERDGVITYEELAREDGLLAALLSPDVELATRGGEREEMISFGFKVHLSPCPVGRCAPPIADTCFDRVLDAGETDVDCGGPCTRACPAGLRCAAPEDCQTLSCSPGGTCAAATCSDGIVDGFEADVDCAGGCAPCATGKTCDTNLDCISNQCDFGSGRCQ